MTLREYKIIEPLIKNIVSDTDVFNSKIEIINRLTQKPVSDIKHLTPEEFESLWNETESNYLLIEKKDILAQRLVLKDKEFSMVPFKSLTIEDFYTIDILNVTNDLSKMLCVLYRDKDLVDKPWQEGTNDYDSWISNEEYFLDMPIEVVLSIHGFFLNILYQLFSLIGESSLMETQINLLNQLLMMLQEGGTTLSLIWQEKILQKLRILIDSVTSIVSISPVT